MTDYAPAVKCSKCDERPRVKGLCVRHYKTAMAAKYRAADPGAARAKRAAWRLKNKERERQQNAIRRERDREKLNAKARAHMKTEKGREYKAAYYAANKERYRLWLNEWRAAHPDRTRAQWSNRQARLRGAVGTHTENEISKLYARQRGCCAVCRADIKDGYHKDHIVALSIGGSNDIGNIQLLCPSCNTSKGAKDHIEFMRGRGFLL